MVLGVPRLLPGSVLKEGMLYFGENGMIVCRKCAGVRESSGEGVVPVTQADMDPPSVVRRGMGV